MHIRSLGMTNNIINIDVMYPFPEARVQLSHFVADIPRNSYFITGKGVGIKPLQNNYIILE
jgi:hypothetical protein